MIINSAIEDFILALKADGLKLSTIRWYRALLEVYAAAHGTQKLDEITPRSIRQYVSNMRDSDYSEDSVHGHIRAVHRFWKWCSEEYGIENPMRNVKYPKQPAPKMPKTVRDDHIVEMLKACKDDPQGVRDKAILALLTDTGCRAQGIVGLKMSDLENGTRRAYVREKGDKMRAVFFGYDTQILLRAWLDIRKPSSDYVFYNLRTLKPLTPNGLLQILYRIARNAGIEGHVNPHAFRHRFGRSMAEQGVNTGVISQIMGHDDPSLTISYYGMFGQDALGNQHRKHIPMKKIKSLQKRRDSE